MILLDTNVVSEPFRSAPNSNVQRWIDAQRPDELFLCTPVLAELHFGVERLPPGLRKTQLSEWLIRTETIEFPDRIIPFDREAAHACGRVMAMRQRLGRPIPTMDAAIAAIALAYGASIATRNENHFAGLDIELINPFAAAA